jgi:hypothetical protein
MLKNIKVVQYGLGPIGLGIVDVLLARPWVQLVGAIDIDKKKVGKDVGQLLENPKNTGVIVSDKASDVLKRTSPHVVTHATSSYMKTVYPQVSGAQNPHDSILIDGVPPVDMTIRGGAHGDIATPATIVNSLPKIEHLEPGLRTMVDLPPIAPCLNFPESDRSVMLKTF